jgi:hypothetical protein
MNAAFRQIGNAVPPLLGLAVVSMIRESGPCFFAQKGPLFEPDEVRDGERPIRRSWSGLRSLIGGGLSSVFGFSFESGS